MLLRQLLQGPGVMAGTGGGGACKVEGRAVGSWASCLHQGDGAGGGALRPLLVPSGLRVCAFFAVVLRSFTEVRFIHSKIPQVQVHTFW